VLAVCVAQVGDAVPVEVTRYVLGVEHGQAVGAQAVDLGLQCMCVGSLVAQPLHDVGDPGPLVGRLPRLREGGDRARVVLELGEGRRVLQGHPSGVHPLLGRGVRCDGQGVVDGGAGQGHALGDLRGRDADDGQLLDGVACLAGVHVLAVDVLADLVDDPVDLVGGGHDAHGHGGGADRDGDDGAALAAQHGQGALVVDVRADDLQHSARPDRRGEVLGVGAGVGAYVGADLQLARGDLVEVADLVGGGGLGVHGRDSFSRLSVVMRDILLACLVSRSPVVPPVDGPSPRSRVWTIGGGSPSPKPGLAPELTVSAVGWVLGRERAEDRHERLVGPTDVGCS